LLFSCLRQLVDVLSAKKFKDILAIGAGYLSQEEVVFLHGLFGFKALCLSI
jgi:hypothetical protein